VLQIVIPPLLFKVRVHFISIGTGGQVVDVLRQRFVSQARQEFSALHRPARVRVACGLFFAAASDLYSKTFIRIVAPGERSRAHNGGQ
jgi:hypothetical protein